MSSLSKPRAKKHCNYCRNHKKSVLEKGHRKDCPYKSCKCHDCRQNYKKTLNTRRSRQNKSKKNIVRNNDDRKLVITAAFRKGISEYLATKDELNKSPESLSLIVYPYNFPQVILFQKTVNMLNDWIDSQPSTAKSCQFQYRKVENGAWKVVCINKETRDRFISLVKGIKLTIPKTGIECPLFVIPENKIFKHLQMSCILNEPITGRQFQTSVASNNRFETSRWECENSVPIDGGHKVNFSVDPIVYRYMLTNDLILSVKNQEIEAKLELNPFLAYMFEECS